MGPSLQTGMDMLFDPAKESTLTVRVGSGLYGDKRGDRQDAMANEGTCVLNLPGELVAGVQTNGDTAGN